MKPARRILSKRNTPHPVPLPSGEGMVLQAPRHVQASLLPPHPLADAVTPSGKLAKASLLGEGQDEGSCALSQCASVCSRTLRGQP